MVLSIHQSVSAGNCCEPPKVPLNIWMLFAISFAEKDKLLRSDYPEVDSIHRPMSDAESQERMVL